MNASRFARPSGFGAAALVAIIVVFVTYMRFKPNRGGPPARYPELTIVYNAEEQPGEKNLVAQVLQAQLGRHGFHVRLDPVPSTVFNDRLSRGNFQATLALWYLDYNDPEGYLTDFYSRSGFRMSKYSDARYDAAYLRGLFAVDANTRSAAWREATGIIDQTSVWVPLYSNNDLFLLRPGARGFVSNAYQYYDYRAVDLPAIRAMSDVEVQTLDPAMAYDLASKHLVTQSYEGLIALDGAARVVPALASSWEVSPDGIRLTFHLRADARFHPSSVLTSEAALHVGADDVKRSFERVLRLNSPYAYIFDHVRGADAFKQHQVTEVTGFRVIDDVTFAIELTRPVPSMLAWLLAPAASVLPAELPESYDFARGSCGTGPFVLQSWDGVTASFRAHQTYWATDSHGIRWPRAQALSIRVIKEPAVALQALHTEELDIAPVPLTAFREVLASGGGLTPAWSRYELREVSLANLKFVAFNMQSVPWGARAEFRRALSDAIDRNALVRDLFRGHAHTARSIIPDGVAAP